MDVLHFGMFQFLHAFSGCSSLMEISLPFAIDKFGDNIFNGVVSLSIAGDIGRIPVKLFNECKSLKSIAIQPSVKWIGKGAFKGCSSLVQIAIPSSVISIESDAIYGCSSLKGISIPSSLDILRIEIGSNVIVNKF